MVEYEFERARILEKDKCIWIEYCNIDLIMINYI